MKKKPAIGIILLFWVLGVFAQTEQAIFLQAKQLYQQKEYVLAKISFEKVANSAVFGAHARFYAGKCLYELGQKQEAVNQWSALEKETPQWSERSDLLFWLAYAQLELAHWSEGIGYMEKLGQLPGESAQVTRLINHFADPLSIEDLDALVDRFPDNRTLAEILVKKMNQLPFGERDFVRLNALVTKWELGSEVAAVALPEVKKQVYDIAVMLPFLYESLENTSVISQNRLVMDLYQGMELAAADLAAMGKPVNLYPFDTKRSEKITRDQLAHPQMKQMDLIVGPLFSGPNAAVNEFSKANRINTINPVSSNNEVIGDNPYSFLLKPSFETMALQMAELAVRENADRNRNAMIFYEDNPRDSAFAAIFSNYLEENGFQIVWERVLGKGDAKRVTDTLAAQYDRYLTQEQADSIQALPRRFVRNRRIRRDEMARMTREADRAKTNPNYKPWQLPISYDSQNQPIVYYEKTFYLKSDSIGLILGATRSSLYASNLIAALEARGDSIRLYTYSDWLDFTMASYTQIERLNIAMAHPDFIDKTKSGYQQLEQRIGQQYKTVPSIHHIRGYELVWFVGQAMHRYGKYFQKGIQSGHFHRGRAFEGFKYEASNDNHVVPVVRFRNNQLEVINRQDYEN